MGFFLSVCGGLFGLWLGSPGKKGVEPKVSFDSVCFCGFSACVVGKKKMLTSCWFLADEPAECWEKNQKELEIQTPLWHVRSQLSKIFSF